MASEFIPWEVPKHPHLHYSTNSAETKKLLDDYLKEAGIKTTPQSRPRLHSFLLWAAMTTVVCSYNEHATFTIPKAWIWSMKPREAFQKLKNHMLKRGDISVVLNYKKKDPAWPDEEARPTYYRSRFELAIDVVENGLLYKVDPDNTSNSKNKDHYRPVVRINNKLRKHTFAYLGVEYQNFKRIFSDCAKDRGGRLYNDYQNLPKDRRGQALIDGEPVAQVDIKACSPTILSAMNHVEEFFDVDDPYSGGNSVPREVIKQLVVEMIGSGNWNKRRLSDHGLASVRKKLGEPSYKPDSEVLSGAMDRLLNGPLRSLQSLQRGILDSETIAYHESNIMIRTILKLDVPAYPVHDCLICKSSDREHVGEVLRATFKEYAEELGWLAVECRTEYE